MRPKNENSSWLIKAKFVGTSVKENDYSMKVRANFVDVETDDDNFPHPQQAYCPFGKLLQSVIMKPGHVMVFGTVRKPLYWNGYLKFEFPIYVRNMSTGQCWQYDTKLRTMVDFKEESN